MTVGVAVEGNVCDMSLLTELSCGGCIWDMSATCLGNVRAMFDLYLGRVCVAIK